MYCVSKESESSATSLTVRRHAVAEREASRDSCADHRIQNQTKWGLWINPG